MRHNPDCYSADPTTQVTQAKLPESTKEP